MVSPNVIIVKSSRLRGLRHVACMEMMHTKLDSEEVKGQDLGVDGRIILKESYLELDLSTSRW
jgi:hypothetical protein